MKGERKVRQNTNDDYVRVVNLWGDDYFIVISKHGVDRQLLRRVDINLIMNVAEEALEVLLEELRLDDRVVVYDQRSLFSYSAHMKANGFELVLTSVVSGKMTGETHKTHKHVIINQKGDIKFISLNEYEKI